MVCCTVSSTLDVPVLVGDRLHSLASAVVCFTRQMETRCWFSHGRSSHHTHHMPECRDVKKTDARSAIARRNTIQRRVPRMHVRVCVFVTFSHY